MIMNRWRSKFRREDFEMKNIKTTVSRIRHYSIVEMMMVIAVFMIILSMAMIAWLNSGDQARLKNAVRLINNQLNLARSKAVAGRKPVGVYFSAKVNNKPQESYAMLVCEDGDKSKPLPYCHWVSLPGGTVITEDEPSSQVNAKVPNKIIFKNDGSIKGSAPANFFVVSGDQTTEKSSKNAPGYYEIEINIFTGRTKTIYHEG